MENSCDPLLHGKGKVAVSIRAERNRSFSVPKGTGAAVSLTRARNYSPALQRCGNSGCMVGDWEVDFRNGRHSPEENPRRIGRPFRMEPSLTWRNSQAAGGFDCARPLASICHFALCKHV